MFFAGFWGKQQRNCASIFISTFESLALTSKILARKRRLEQKHQKIFYTAIIWTVYHSLWHRRYDKFNGNWNNRNASSRVYFFHHHIYDCCHRKHAGLLGDFSNSAHAYHSQLPPGESSGVRSHGSIVLYPLRCGIESDATCLASWLCYVQSVMAGYDSLYKLLRCNTCWH